MRGLGRARAVGALTAVVGVLLAACGGGAPTVTPSGGAPSSEATESASPAESATPTETASEVLPANDVEDPLEALQAIWDYYDYLAANPDPDKLELIFHPECDCYDLVIDTFREMQEAGTHIEVTNRLIDEVEIVEELETVVQIRFRNRADAVTFYRADGSEGDSEAIDRRLNWALVRQGGRWVVRQDA